MTIVSLVEFQEFWRVLMISSIHAQWFSIHHSVNTLQSAMTLSCCPTTASEYIYDSTQWFHISIIIVTDVGIFVLILGIK